MPHVLTLTMISTLALAGCTKASAPTSADPASATPSAEPAPDPLAGRPVVLNVDAKPGDVTTCPYSGRTFVVAADHPKVEYQGKRYTLCSQKAADAVQADPGKYLDAFAG